MKKQKKETKKKAVKVNKSKKVVNENPEPQPIHTSDEVVDPTGDVSEEILVEQPAATETVFDEIKESEEGFIGGIRGTEYKVEENATRETSESDRQLTEEQKEKLQNHFLYLAGEHKGDIIGSVAEVIRNIAARTGVTDDEVRMIIAL